MTSALKSAAHARLPVPFLDVDKIIGDRENKIIIWLARPPRPPQSRCARRRPAARSSY
jgi:hypothetical protein